MGRHNKNKTARQWEMMNAMDAVANARVDSLNVSIIKGDSTAIDVLNRMEKIELNIYRNFLHEFVYKAILSKDETTRKSAELLVLLNRQNINANRLNLTPDDKNTIHNVIDYTDVLVMMDVVEPTHVKQAVDLCLLYTSPSPRDLSTSRMPSSA